MAMPCGSVDFGSTRAGSSEARRAEANFEASSANPGDVGAGDARSKTVDAFAAGVDEVDPIGGSRPSASLCTFCRHPASPIAFQK